VTVAHLDKECDQVGVVVHSTKIMEEITEKGVKILWKAPYNNWLRAIFLSDLAIQNQFPPISFLFRRTIYTEVGGFDESLPVLGDWDFHLKCNLKNNIGVIPKELAYYHHRPDAGNSAYANSITAAIDKHAYYESVVRNNFLRQDISNNSMGLGVLLSMGRYTNMLTYKLSPLEKIFTLLRKVGRKTRLDRFL